jgi:hypothetical protein
MCAKVDVKSRNIQRNRNICAGVGLDGVLIEANGVVPGEEDEDSHEGVPGKLDDDVCDHESFPGVCFAGTFADFIERALRNEMGHDLLDELAEDGHEHEDTKHLVLETLLGVGCLEERETDEEAREDAERGLGVDVRGGAPVLLEDTDGNFAELFPKRRGKLAIGGLVFPFLCRNSAFECSLLGALVLELCEVFLNSGVFGRVAPRLVPVDIGRRSRSCTNDFEHPFGGVSRRRARHSALSLEVVDQDTRVGTDLTKVHSLATLLEEQKTIEAREKHSGRLMNSAKNSLAVLLELVQEVENSPRSLRVQSGGRFVEEQEKGWLCSQFDTDGKTLALLDVETFSRNTDDGIGIFRHFQKLDDFLNVLDLLLPRDVSRLAKDCRKGKSFADRRGGQMEILLLSVTGLALERVIARFSVNEHLSGDDTHSSTGGQAVQKRSFTGT